MPRQLTRGLGERTLTKEIRTANLPQKGLMGSINTDSVNTTMNGSAIVSLRVESFFTPTILALASNATPSMTKGIRTRGIGLSGNVNPIRQTTTNRSLAGSSYTTTISLINANSGRNLIAPTIVGFANSLWRVYAPLTHSVYDGFNGGSQDISPPNQGEAVKNYGIYETVNTIKGSGFIQSDSLMYNGGKPIINTGILSLSSPRATASNGNFQFQIRTSNVVDFIQSANYLQPNTLTRQNARFVLNQRQVKINAFIPR